MSARGHAHNDKATMLIFNRHSICHLHRFVCVNMLSADEADGNVLQALSHTPEHWGNGKLDLMNEG